MPPNVILNLFNVVQHDHQLWNFVFCDIEEHKNKLLSGLKPHGSLLITHSLKTCSFVLLSKKNPRAIIQICQNTRKRDFGFSDQIRQ